ncbi:MAG: hypothetical protein WBC44_13950 [Planctomycetaceae bacterium]
MMDFGIAAVTGWSALRAVVDALFAVVAGAAIAGELRRSPLGGRRVLWMLILATILAPDLIAGYAFSNFSLSLIRDPAWNEAFLTLLIGLKATAIAAVMLHFSPAPALTPAGSHLLRLAGERIGWLDRMRIIGRGEPSRMLPALGIAFLFAFQQFELPSLTGATAWTVTLFDRQAQVPDPWDSARPLVWPLAVELVALAPVPLFILAATASKRRAVPPMRRRSVERGFAWLVAFLTASLTAAVPFGILVVESVPGLGYVLEGTPTAVSFWREVATALGYGIAAAVFAFLPAVGLLRLTASPRWRPVGMILLLVACVPGLCGPLVPSLFAVAWLQTPWLLPLRDTLVPLVTVLALFLLPRAILLEALARSVREAPAIHLARRLRASPIDDQRRAGRLLIWDLDGFGRYCRVSLLAYWGYLDLTAATILAPAAVVPVTARLYNLMHYGHNASLSTMALLAVVVPAVAFAALLVVRRLVLRLAVR